MKQKFYQNFSPQMLGYALLCKVYVNNFAQSTNEKMKIDEFPENFGVKRPFKLDVNESSVSKSITGNYNFYIMNEIISVRLQAFFSV
jgi:hypothetical protein